MHTLNAICYANLLWELRKSMKTTHTLDESWYISTGQSFSTQVTDFNGCCAWILELVAHHTYYTEFSPSDYHLLPNRKKKFGWGTVSQRFWFFYLLMTFWSKGGMLHHQSDQRSPTPMEEFCKPYGEIMLKNKCHLFTFREIVFVSLCTLQPTNVAWKFVLSLNKYWKQMLYRDTWIWFKKKKKVKVRKRSNICESIKPEISQRIFL